MQLSLPLIVILLLAGTSSFSQKMNMADSLKCTQYLDTVTNRMLYRFTEKDVHFRGGDEGLARYVQRKLTYDKSQVKYRLMIYFTLLVEADGAITNVALQKVLSHTPNDVIESGLKILSELPKPKPAECNGQKVAVRKLIPVMVVPESYSR